MEIQRDLVERAIDSWESVAVPSIERAMDGFWEKTHSREAWLTQRRERIKAQVQGAARISEIVEVVVWPGSEGDDAANVFLRSSSGQLTQLWCVLEDGVLKVRGLSIDENTRASGTWYPSQGRARRIGAGMSPYKSQLTVGQLRKLIADLPDDMPVYTEGCDCVGPSDGVLVEADDQGDYLTYPTK